jgi:hypothetical protein
MDVTPLSAGMRVRTTQHQLPLEEKALVGLAGLLQHAVMSLIDYQFSAYSAPDVFSSPHYYCT